ncbi:HIT family protein [Leptospira sp. WS92.C1]
MLDCPICQIHHSGENVEILAHFGAFAVRHSEKEKRLKGYLYIEPILHWTSYQDWTTGSFVDFGNALQFATERIYQDHSPLKIYTVTVSEMIPHIHFHLIPRYTEELKGVDYIRLALQGKLPDSSYIRDL